jgi:hypothetical protein
MNFHPVAYPLLPAKTTRTSRAIAAREARHDEDLRALLALSLINGAPIPRMSERAAAKAVNVSRYKIRLAALTTPTEAHLVKTGHLRLQDVGRAHAKSREMTVVEIADFVCRADPVRVLAYLDRLTAPAVSLAAE